MKPRELGFLAAILGLAADQGSKFFLLYRENFVHMGPGQAMPVLPFFNLVMAWNPGISYGLFPASSALGTWTLIAFCVAAVAGLGWWMWGMTSWSLAAGIGLIIGGALGNVIDRLVYGRVADFFHFYGFGFDWYVFNVADIAITLGAIAIVYEVLKPEHG
ncbi:MAG TPA: signal peptidase II [Rhizomicrobium sp.]|nr:signal peptidase II [Rhizomicrobium sp.]